MPSRGDRQSGRTIREIYHLGLLHLMSIKEDEFSNDHSNLVPRCY